jgi:hypothetical protein
VVGGTGDESVESIVKLSDGRFLLGGATTSFGDAASNSLFVRLTGDGFVERLVAGGSAERIGRELARTSAGHLWVAGASPLGDDVSMTGRNAYVAHLDPTGTPLEHWTWGGTGNESVLAILNNLRGR